MTFHIPVMFKIQKQPEVQKVWIVFRVMSSGGAHTNGVFLTEESAVKHADKDEGIALVEVGKRLPFELSDCEKCYFPHQERWEQSVLFKLQQMAKATVVDFFRVP